SLVGLEQEVRRARLSDELVRRFALLGEIRTDQVEDLFMLAVTRPCLPYIAADTQQLGYRCHFVKLLPADKHDHYPHRVAEGDDFTACETGRSVRQVKQRAPLRKKGVVEVTIEDWVHKHHDCSFRSLTTGQ